MPLELIEVEAAIVVDRLAGNLHLPGAGDADLLRDVVGEGWAREDCIAQEAVEGAAVIGPRVTYAKTEHEVGLYRVGDRRLELHLGIMPP